MGDEAVKSTLREYKERTEKDDAMKLTPFLKCLEAVGLKEHKSTVETSVWNLHADSAKKCTIDKIVSHVIPDLAADTVARKKGLKGRAPHDDPDVVKMIEKIKEKFAAKAGQAAHTAKATDSTTARLTDTSKYTGTHKERFDESGKGKGVSGREDVASNSGYVSGYKNEGTYEKK